MTLKKIQENYFPNRTVSELRITYYASLKKPLFEEQDKKIVRVIKNIEEELFYCIVYNSRNNLIEYSFGKIAAELSIDENCASTQTINNRVKAIEPFFNILKEQKNQELAGNLLNIIRETLINNTLTKEQKISIIYEF